MSYHNIIDPNYVRDQLTLKPNESPASVANGICKREGITDPVDKENILRRVEQLVHQNGWRYVSIDEMDTKTRIRALRKKVIGCDEAFVRSTLVDILELSLGDFEMGINPDIKTALNTVNSIGKLKQTDAFKTSQDVNMNLTGDLSKLSDEEVREKARQLANEMVGE